MYSEVVVSDCIYWLCFQLSYSHLLTAFNIVWEVCHSWILFTSLLLLHYLLINQSLSSLMLFLLWSLKSEYCSAYTYTAWTSSSQFCINWVHWHCDSSSLSSVINDIRIAVFRTLQTFFLLLLTFTQISSAASFLFFLQLKFDSLMIMSQTSQNERQEIQMKNSYSTQKFSLYKAYKRLILMRLHTTSIQLFSILSAILQQFS